MESPTSKDRDIPESEFSRILVVNSTLRAKRKAMVRARIQDDLARERQLRKQKLERKNSKEKGFEVDVLGVKEERVREISTTLTVSTQGTPTPRNQPLPTLSTPVVGDTTRSGHITFCLCPQPHLLSITKSEYERIATQPIPSSRFPEPPAYPPPDPPCPCNSPSCVARRQAAESPKLTYQWDVKPYKS
jgi:hypothetical protein